MCGVRVRVGDGGGPGPWGGRGVEILRGVDLRLGRGESVALVGPSGSGKTTLARVAVGLVRPASGRVRVAGLDPSAPGSSRRLGRRVQMVFQDPGSSLNPAMRLGEIVVEPGRVGGLLRGRAERRARGAELLEMVGLPGAWAGRFPHQLSGGQRQRVAIARALGVGPTLLVCDEPTSALDMSIRAEIVNLLLDLRSARGFSLLLITHDLPLARHLCGRVVELREGVVTGMNAESGRARINS